MVYISYTTARPGHFLENIPGSYPPLPGKYTYGFDDLINCKRSIAKVLALMLEAFVVSDPYMYPVFFIKVCLSYSVRIKC